MDYLVLFAGHSPEPWTPPSPPPTARRPAERRVAVVALQRHRYFREVRCFCNWRRAAGYTENNPFRGLRNVRLPRKIVPPLALPRDARRDELSNAPSLTPPAPCPARSLCFVNGG